MVVLGVLWWTSRPDGKTKVIFCDVGQGDGALIIQGNNQVLIDVGPNNGLMERCLSRHLPFWDRQLEVVIISHWDTDHCGGLTNILKKYQVKNLYANEHPKDSFEQKFYTADLGQNDVLRIDKIEFDVLWPEKVVDGGNDDSVVIESTLAGRRYLFTGDVGKEVEQKLVWRKILNSNTSGVLKISHHGSDTGTSAELLKYWKPEVAVISVGKNNKYNHPSTDVLLSLEELGVKVWRTDREGELVLFN